jgi:hypothetical protein
MPTSYIMECRGDGPFKDEVIRLDKNDSACFASMKGKKCISYFSYNIGRDLREDSEYPIREYFSFLLSVPEIQEITGLTQTDVDSVIEKGIEFDTTKWGYNTVLAVCTVFRYAVEQRKRLLTWKQMNKWMGTHFPERDDGDELVFYLMHFYDCHVTSIYGTWNCNHSLYKTYTGDVKAYKKGDLGGGFRAMMEREKNIPLICSEGSETYKNIRIHTISSEGMKALDLSGFPDKMTSLGESQFVKIVKRMIE